MKLSEYQDEVLRTSGMFGEGEGLDRQAMTLLALSGEVGELCNLFKKQVGHGYSVEPSRYADELGDVLWYLADLVDAFGFSLDEIASVNLSKLKERYPNGFSEEASQNRKQGGDDVESA